MTTPTTRADVRTPAERQERGIVAYPHEVRAILDGRKTQTRRVIKFRQFGRSDTPGYDWTFRGTRRGATRGSGSDCWQDLRHEDLLRLCPFGTVGDVLWVRETWFHGDSWYPVSPSLAWKNCVRDGQCTWVDYRADANRVDEAQVSWRASIHMPRWASRLLLEIVGVRVQRLQEIHGGDVAAEGIDCGLLGGQMVYHEGAFQCVGADPVTAFRSLWDSINGKTHPWESDPWVWCVTFRRMP